MKKVWICDKYERCMFIICDVRFPNGKRARAGRAIYRDEWEQYIPEYQAALFEQHVRNIDYDILQIGAL